MPRIGLALLALLMSATVAAAQRYRPIEVYLDSGTAPLAAYQLELVAEGDAQIVGVEGGAAPAFADPPAYDAKALTGGRVILAAFSLGDAADLPRGRTRVATVHVRQPGAAPRFTVRVQAAAGPDGVPITATASLALDQGDPT
jgi:hypothetical protein